MHAKRFFVLIGMMLLLCGCSFVFHPKKHTAYNSEPEAGSNPIDIVLSMDRVGPYPEGCSVWLVNNLTDSGEEAFKKGRGNTFSVNYYEWTEFFIQEWREQLIKRGVDVTPQSPNVLYVALQSFDWEQGAFVIKSELEVKIFKQGAGWLRTYYGHARRPGHNFNAAVYQTIGELLDKEDVVNQMRVE